MNLARSAPHLSEPSHTPCALVLPMLAEGIVQGAEGIDWHNTGSSLIVSHAESVESES
jgi:hypothetical protein